MAFGSAPPAKRARFGDGNSRNGHNQASSSSSGFGAIPAQLNDFRRIQAERSNLPVFRLKTEILQQIANNSTLILIGETGCGKTTQIPQFIYEANLHGETGIIGITQPRRVAAVSLSLRVAKETGVELGREYQTDGMLLREAITDPLLKRYSVIILDEAHERTLHTDVMFAIVKEAQKQRQIRKMAQLKILVLSATIDVDHFAAYFNDAPVVYVEGRQYPIKLFFTMNDSSDYIHDTIVAIFQQHQHRPLEQGILAFLTGQDEIDQVVRRCREVARQLSPTSPKMTILPLYAALSPQAQLKVFESVPGTRKVVISTNIAETSVTIPGISIVIDAGKVKSRVYDASRGIDMLKVNSVSKSQAWQRTGRAGREAPGICFRLYTELKYESLSPHSIPEILRCNLSSVVLELLAMRITNIYHFDFMDKPKPEAITAAIKELKFLGAVDEIDEPSASSSKPKLPVLTLTRLGTKMSRLALDPKLSRMLLASNELRCVSEILSIVSILSTDNFFLNPASKKEECEAARRKYFSPEGDLIMRLNVFRAYKQAKKDGNAKEWCVANFMNLRSIGIVDQVREQLRDACIRLEMDADSSCGQNTQVVRKAICYGFFMNAAEMDPGGGYHLVESGLNAHIHPSSCLFQHKPGFLVYGELVLTNQLCMRDVTVVDAEFLFEAAREYFKHKHVTNGIH